MVLDNVVKLINHAPALGEYLRRPEAQPLVRQWHETLGAVTQRLQEPGRFYHGVGHIVWMLDKLGEWGDATGLTGAQRVELELAIIYHDAIYVPGSATNETDSAELARTDLTALGFDPSGIATIVLTIEATTTHECDPNDTLSNWIIDLDLAAIADDEAYRVNGLLIREEFGYVSDEDFRNGRMKFLSNYLAHKHLFKTHLGQTLEAAARRNMSAELSKLSEQ